MANRFIIRPAPGQRFEPFVRYVVSLAQGARVETDTSRRPYFVRVDEATYRRWVAALPTKPAPADPAPAPASAPVATQSAAVAQAAPPPAAPAAAAPEAKPEPEAKAEPRPVAKRARRSTTSRKRDAGSN